MAPRDRSRPGLPADAAPVRTMTVSAEHHGRDVVLTATGELDQSTSPKLSRLIRLALVDQPRRLVLDLSQLRFINSSGLGLLASTHRETAPAQLRVVAGTVVRRLLSVTDLLDMLTVHTSLEEALAS